MVEFLQITVSRLFPEGKPITVIRASLVEYLSVILASFYFDANLTITFLHSSPRGNIAYNFFSLLKESMSKFNRYANPTLIL